MKWLALSALLLCAACPDAPGTPDAAVGLNPPQLWLSLDGTELKVRLSPVEPVPF